MYKKIKDRRKQKIIEKFYQVIIEDLLERASLISIDRWFSVSPSLLISHAVSRYLMGSYRIATEIKAKAVTATGASFTTDFTGGGYYRGGIR